jgi:uncharacterized tellurite resistance protein B-like protein
VLKALKSLFGDNATAQRPQAREFEQRQLRSAVAVLLADAERADLEVGPDEIRASHRALIDLFGVSEAQAVELMALARTEAVRLTSYFGLVSVINRGFSVPRRVQLVEHLWRVAYAHGGLDPYEDHLVRKVSHLLYVPHIDLMLARQRVRDANGT